MHKLDVSIYDFFFYLYYSNNEKSIWESFWNTFQCICIYVFFMKFMYIALLI